MLALTCVACVREGDCVNLFGLPCPKNDAERSSLMLVGFPSAQFDFETVLRTGVRAPAPMPLGQRIPVRLDGQGVERVRSVRCVLTDPAVVRFQALTALSGTLEATAPGVTGVSVTVTFEDGSTRQAGLYACGRFSSPAVDGCGLVEAIRVVP